MNLSKHFTLAEMTTTSVRIYSNTPTMEEVDNLTYLCVYLLEPLRTVFGPMHTTSGYRSSEVNKFIGGSPSSMHVPGCAWDGIFKRDRVRWSDVIKYCLEHPELPLDQVIYEYGRWLHIGTRPRGENCRHEAKMIFPSTDPETPAKYELWNPADKRITH